MRRVRRQKRSGDVITGRSANFNRRKTKGIEGDHLIQCDITGQVCLRSEARMTWRGLLVSNQNWDPKHPQLTIDVPPEDISVRDARSFKGSFIETADTVVDTGFVSLTDQTVGFTQEPPPNPPTDDLGASSGVTPGTVLGLIADTTITAQNNGVPTVMALGTTATSQTNATRIGTESFFTDSIATNTPRVSMYTQATISTGTKRYVEFNIVTSLVGSNTLPRIGYEVVGFENPGVDAGDFTGEFGISLRGQVTRSGSASTFTGYAVGDVVSLSYSVSSASVSIIMHVNGIFLQEIVAGLSNRNNLPIRPVITLAATSASWFGNEAQILTHQGVQTFAPPDTYLPLET